MRTIQIVVDAELLARLDALVRKRHVSRSAFIRQSLSAALEEARLQELVEADRRGYEARPLTAEDKRGLGALARAQARLAKKLGRGETW